MNDGFFDGARFVFDYSHVFNKHSGSRQTGRTTRMVNEAISEANNGTLVLVLFVHHEQAIMFREAAKKEGRDLTNIAFATYGSFKQAIKRQPSSIDPNFIPGPDKKVIVYFDHDIYENGLETLTAFKF